MFEEMSRNVWFSWKKVFGNKNYVLLTFVVAILFYLFNALLNNINNIAEIYLSFGFLKTIELTFNLVIGFHHTLLDFSLVSLILISLFSGILISLVVFKYRINLEIRRKSGFLAGIGFFLGFLVPGCASCGIGLIAFLGLTSSLLVLPFNGKEISVIAILIILFAILKFSNDIFKCKHLNRIGSRKIR